MNHVLSRTSCTYTTGLASPRDFLPDGLNQSAFHIVLCKLILICALLSALSLHLGFIWRRESAEAWVLLFQWNGLTEGVSCNEDSSQK